jgi:hypothetical protein
MEAFGTLAEEVNTQGPQNKSAFDGNTHVAKLDTVWRTRLRLKNYSAVLSVQISNNKAPERMHNLDQETGNGSWI